MGYSPYGYPSILICCTNVEDSFLRKCFEFFKPFPWAFQWSPSSLLFMGETRKIAAASLEDCVTLNGLPCLMRKDHHMVLKPKVYCYCFCYFYCYTCFQKQTMLVVLVFSYTIILIHCQPRRKETDTWQEWWLWSLLCIGHSAPKSCEGCCKGKSQCSLSGSISRSSPFFTQNRYFKKILSALSLPIASISLSLQPFLFLQTEIQCYFFWR